MTDYDNRMAIHAARRAEDWVALNALVEVRVLHGFPLAEDDHLVDTTTGAALHETLETDIFTSILRQQDRAREENS